MRQFQFILAPVVMSFMFANTGHSALARTDASGLLLTANKGSHTLGIIDPDGKKPMVTVPEDGITGHEVAASADGRVAYVPIYGNSGVGKPGTDGRNMMVIDVASHNVVGNVDFGHPVRPHHPVFDKNSGMLYVTTELDQTVTIIDGKTLKIVGSVPTGQPESHMLAISKDGRRGYTANVGPGTVSVLDLKTKKTVAVIPISKETQRISITPDDRMVFTADQTKPQIAVIDTAQNKVKQWVALPSVGFGTAVTHDGRWLLATLPSARKVAVIDLAAMKVVNSIDVPAAPQEILIRPDDKVAYVSCDSSQKIAAIQISDWSVNLLDSGKGTDGLAWAAAR
jgi:DNA-binding beta-propeller fold protein YncE